MLPGDFKTKHLSIFRHEACQRLIGSPRVHHGKVAEEGEAGRTWGQQITVVYISVVLDGGEDQAEVRVEMREIIQQGNLLNLGVDWSSAWSRRLAGERR